VKGKKSIGTELRALRVKSGLGIKTVGRTLDVSYTYLSKVENDHKQPSEELLRKLAQVYQTDAESLLPLIGALPPDIRRILNQHGEAVFDLIRKSFDSKKARQ
jgi:transcriptional regulator with XRE-family HTH domain